MFARLPDLVAAVPIEIDGVRHHARAGDSIAAALLAAGVTACRVTAISGAPRAPFCVMGACFECMVKVDGRQVQACVERVKAGMRIVTPRGAKVAAMSRKGRPDGEFRSAQREGEPLSPPGRSNIVDVAIVGAGPAGLAAASACARLGLDSLVLDEQPSPGGQVYRAITASPLPRAEILGDDYWRGAALIVDVVRAGARYRPDTTVWAIEPRDTRFVIATSQGHGESRATVPVDARVVILATGALERPFPVEGWTLPGVMMAGGAQALLKSAGVVPMGETVLAGCGPLLWLLAAQYLRAGVPVAALLDTTPRGRLAQSLPHAPAFMASPYFAKGRELVRYVRRRTRVIEFVEALAIEGREAVTGVRYRQRGVEQRLPADQVLLHQGVVPDVNLASASGCRLAWNDEQRCFTPHVDGWGGSSVPGLFIAGDGAGIAGADAAAARGMLTGLAVANALGRLDGAARDREALPHRRALAAATRGRRFLDALYRPAEAFRLPTGDTLACRCEEITAGAVRELAREGVAGPNQMKALTRCGMGPCQGRYCALTVTELIAEETGRSPADVGTYRCRFPTKPVPLAGIAAMPSSAEDVRVVERD